MSRECGSQNGFGSWGGYMEAKITKLGDQYAAASDPFRKSTLFNGIAIFVNGRTDPSADELKRIMMVYGGMYHHYMLPTTTYIIASNLPDVKIRNMNTSKIISPKWVVDCVKAQRILDYTNYLLYTNHNNKQPKIAFANVKAKTETNSVYQAKSEQSSEGSNKLNILSNLKALANAFNVNMENQQPKACNDDTLTKPAVIVKTEPEGTLLEAEAKQCEDSLTAEPEEELAKEHKLLAAENVSCTGDQNITNITNIVPIANSTTVSNTTLNVSVAPQNRSTVARTAVDPNFLNEFFNNSRLHHIATLGADLKQHVCELRRQHNISNGFPERQQLKQLIHAQGYAETVTQPLSECVMHIDMDCFFVSVGLRSRPHLRDKPVAVTHSQGGTAASAVPVHPNANREVELDLFAQRFEHVLHNEMLTEKVRNGFLGKKSLSEIASCNYVARQKGVRNGMFVGAALDLCPDLVTIPYDFEAYKEVSYALYNTIAAYTLNIEAVSCDEMFVDLVDVLGDLQVQPLDFVTAIRDLVFQRTGCPCSAGVGANRLQARLATRRAKPNGQFYLKAEDVQEYMMNIPLQDLPTVGSSTRRILENANIFTCGDMQQLSLDELQKLLGKVTSKKLHNFCRGIDTNPLVYEQVRKSVSAEVNYGIRFTNNTELDTFLRQLCAELHSRLLHIKRSTKSITLKVMVRAKEAPIETSKFMGHGVCDNITKTTPLNNYTNSIDVITENVLKMMLSLNIAPNELRGIGVQLNKLDEPQQLQTKSNELKSMFSRVEERQKKIQQNKENVKEPEPTSVTIEINMPTDKMPANVTASTSTTKRGAKRGPKKVDNAVVAGQANILSLFHAAPQKQQEIKKRKIIPNLPLTSGEIDPEVLAALPAYIREEIMSAVVDSAPAKPKICLTDTEAPELPPNIDADVFKALPNDLRKEIIDTVPHLKTTPNIVNTMSTTILNESDLQPSTSKAAAVKQLSKISYKVECPPLLPVVTKDVPRIISAEPGIPAETLRDWVLNNEEPSEFDVKFLAKMETFKVGIREISNMYEELALLQRLIKRWRTDNCHWHKAFKYIMQEVNKEMIDRYNNRKLFILPEFNCKQCDEAFNPGDANVNV